MNFWRPRLCLRDKSCEPVRQVRATGETDVVQAPSSLDLHPRIYLGLRSRREGRLPKREKLGPSSDPHLNPP